MADDEHDEHERTAALIGHFEASTDDGSGYGRGHTAPADEEYNSPMHDVENMMPGVYDRPDLYDHFSGAGQPHVSHESIQQLKKARGNPDADIDIYRAQPREHRSIRNGDWVTASANYARLHADSNLHNRPWAVVKSTVKARHLLNEGDLNEWGYSGPDIENAKVHVHGGPRKQASHEVVAHFEEVPVPQRKKAARQREGDERAFGDYTMRYRTTDEGERRPRHVIEAWHPDAGQPAGKLSWRGSTRRVESIDVSPQHRGRGLATAMWDWSQEMTPRPQHSTDQTDRGKEWVKGLKDRKRPVTAVAGPAGQPHPRTDQELHAHLSGVHRLNDDELAGTGHWELHHDEHSGGWDDPDHRHEQFYHGTSLGHPDDEDPPEHVVPQGGAHLYPGEHTGEHAFATTSRDSAWTYAEKAWASSRGSQPRVLHVRPTGPFEEDPDVSEHGVRRSVGEGAVRSRHPWAVTGEEDIPEEHLQDRDGSGERDHEASLTKEAAVAALVNPHNEDGRKAFGRTWEGEPDTWYHGSPYAYHHMDSGHAADDESTMNGPSSVHWNNLLGGHFAGHEGTAAGFVHESSSGDNEADASPGYIYHARLHIRNPRHYDSEYDMDREAYGHEYDQGNHPVNHDPDFEELHEGDPHLSHHEDLRAQGDTRPVRDPISGTTFNADNRGRYMRWLSQHPDKAGIAARFKGRLEAAGHDGITYGNEIERQDHGANGGICAVNFHPHQVQVTQRHEYDPRREHEYDPDNGYNCKHGEEAEAEERRWPSHGQMELPFGEHEAALEIVAHFEETYAVSPQTAEESWQHLQEMHGARPSGNSDKMPSADFVSALHRRFHNGKAALPGAVPHRHEAPAQSSPPQSGADFLSRMFTPIPEAELEEQRRAREPKPERTDDREYSVKDVSRHYDWEGFDPHEISHLVHRPEHAVFTREDIPVKSLRMTGEHGELKPPHSYSEIAGQGENERERLENLRQGYDNGDPVPPIVAVRDGEHHIIADGSHRAAVHAENGQTHIPAFVTQRTIRPGEHQAARELTGHFEATASAEDGRHPYRDPSALTVQDRSRLDKITDGQAAKLRTDSDEHEYVWGFRDDRPHEKVRHDQVEATAHRNEADESAFSRGHDMDWEEGHGWGSRGQVQHWSGTCRNCGASMTVGADHTSHAEMGGRDAGEGKCAGPGTAWQNDMMKDLASERFRGAVSEYGQGVKDNLDRQWLKDQGLHPEAALGPSGADLARTVDGASDAEGAAHQDGSLSWDEIGARHPSLYGSPEEHGEEAEYSDGEGIGEAANELAHGREGDTWAESHSVHDLDFHPRTVDPSQIDYHRSEPGDPRVEHARQGYRDDPERVPPLVLVHRHGVYQVADGHHRAEAADSAGKPVRAYVADSPHEHESFGGQGGEPPARAPFHGASHAMEATEESYPGFPREEETERGRGHFGRVLRQKYGRQPQGPDERGRMYHEIAHRDASGAPTGWHVRDHGLPGGELPVTHESAPGRAYHYVSREDPEGELYRWHSQTGAAYDRHLSRPRQAVLGSACDTVLPPEGPFAAVIEAADAMGAWQPASAAEAYGALRDMGEVFAALQRGVLRAARLTEDLPVDPEVPEGIHSLARCLRQAVEDHAVAVRVLPPEDSWEEPPAHPNR